MMARRRKLPGAGRMAAAATATGAAAMLALAFASAATGADGSAEQAKQQQAQSVPLECKDGFELGGRKYNFAEVTRTYDVVFSDSDQIANYHYAIRFCDKLPNSNCDGARICEDSRTFVNGSSVLFSKKLAGDEAPTATLVGGGDPPAQPNVTLSFKEVSSALHATVVLSCNPDVDDNTAKPVLRSKDTTTITFAWQTKAACSEAPKTNPPSQPEPKPKEPEPKPNPEPQPQPQPQPPKPDKPGEGQPPPKTAEPGKKGMSAAGVFFLVLFVCVAAYFIAGVYYNRTVYGAHGWDLIPHSDFWRELPSLISDVVRHIYNSLFNRAPSGYSSMA